MLAHLSLERDTILMMVILSLLMNLLKSAETHMVLVLLRVSLQDVPLFLNCPLILSLPPLIDIKDKDYDFSLDLSYLDIVEKEPFCGIENESVVAHMNEISTMSALFSDDFKMRKYFVTKIFPFSLKGEARAWFNRLPPGSIDSHDCLIASFFQKYFPPSARHAAL